MVAWLEVPIESNAMWKQVAKENSKNGEAGYFWWHCSVAEKGLAWGFKFPAQAMVREPERFYGGYIGYLLLCNNLTLEFSGLKWQQTLNPHSFRRSGIQEWLIWIVMAQGLQSAEDWSIHFKGTTSRGCKVGVCVMSIFTSSFCIMYFKSVFRCIHVLTSYVFLVSWLLSLWNSLFIPNHFPSSEVYFDINLI